MLDDIYITGLFSATNKSFLYVLESIFRAIFMIRAQNLWTMQTYDIINCHLCMKTFVQKKPFAVFFMLKMCF